MPPELFDCIIVDKKTLGAAGTVIPNTETHIKKNIFRRKNAKEEEKYEDFLRGEETKYLQKYL